MSITGCVFLGLVSGFVASKIMKGSGPGLLVDLIFAVVGAVVGGAALGHFDQTAPAGFTSSSAVAAVAGAVLVLVALRVIGRFGRVA
jgi:uncharacterized membrane protein YeaQ/YmgE (transglycosylase-associated protein family)